MAEQNETMNFQLTTAGHSLIVQAMAGKAKLDFTTAVASTDNHFTDTDEAMQALTELDNVQQTVNITQVSIDETDQTRVKIPTMFNQKDVTTDYTLLTVGLYCKADGGDEVLYGVCGLQNGIPMHKTEDSSSYVIQLYVTVGDTDNVTVKVDPSGMVSRDELNNLMSAYTTTSDLPDFIKAHIPSDIARTGVANTFTQPQTFSKGALAPNGKSYITADDVKPTDLSPYALNADMLAKLALKADASDMTAKLALKANQADMNTQLATKVVDNKNGTVSVNGKTITPLNGGLTVINATTDANSLQTTGIWSSNGVGFSNVPAGFEMWSTIFSLDNAGSNSTQIIFNTSTGGMATRGRKRNTMWTAWSILASAVDVTNAINALRTELNNNINTAKQAAINQIQPMINAEFTKRNAPSAWWNGTAAQYAAVNPKIATAEYNVYE